MILFENIIVHLPLSDEADTGSGGDRPWRNNLTNGNRTGSASSPILFFYSNCSCLKKRFASVEAREITSIINLKKGQHISGQDINQWRALGNSQCRQLALYFCAKLRRLRWLLSME
jgi:hypothetical protein